MIILRAKNERVISNMVWHGFANANANEYMKDHLFELRRGI